MAEFQRLTWWIKETALIPYLYPEPIEINKLYEELSGMPIEFLKQIRKIQVEDIQKCQDDAKRAKLAKGLEIISKVMREKEVESYGY